MTQYVEMAASASIPYVVVRIENEPDMAAIEAALRPRERNRTTLLS